MSQKPKRAATATGECDVADPAAWKGHALSVGSNEAGEQGGNVRRNRETTPSRQPKNSRRINDTQAWSALMAEACIGQHAMSGVTTPARVRMMFGAALLGRNGYGLCRV
uniref:Uncharacterized protein n=2 Tax=viral metagenome TaxID=1070528 RepID=A0A6H1ZRK4_9ZZZZ